MKIEKVITIIGPTAVGKTNLSIELAKKLDTEIISGDSMLVYKGFSIGTAKPTRGEQSGVKHHFIDILESDAEFNVTQFKELAAAQINEINKMGKIPIIAGGTGLYVKSLLEDYQFNETPGDEKYRMQLEELAREKGKEYVHAMLEKVDPVAANRLHINDFRRVIRALEVYHLGGESISQEKGVKDNQLVYNAMVIGLMMERSHLYERINERVDLMVDAGLIDEVKQLLHHGVSPTCQAMKGIGYKEIVEYLQGEVSLDYAIEHIKKSTRHFAKRQLTWFRKMPYIRWYNVEKYTPNEIVEEIYKDVAGYFLIK